MKGFLFVFFGTIGMLLAVTASAQSDEGNSTGIESDSVEMIYGNGVWMQTESPDAKKILSDRTLDILNRSSGKEFDDRFTQTMIIHHEGGIMLANAVLARSSDPDIREIAQKMIDEEQNDIDAMNEIRAGLNLSDYNSTNRTLDEGAAINMVDALIHDRTADWVQSLSEMDAEFAFLNEMKLHHMDAIKMSQIALDNADSEDVLNLSEQMIENQVWEIGEMSLIEMDRIMQPPQPFDYNLGNNTQSYYTQIQRSPLSSTQNETSAVNTSENGSNSSANNSTINSSANTSINSSANTTNSSENSSVNATNISTNSSEDESDDESDEWNESDSE